VSAVTFLVELLVKAGVNRQLALQLAQAYLAAHGVAFDLARAVEQILEELARGGGGAVVGAVAGATLTDSGGAAPGGFGGGPQPSSAQTLEALFGALSQSSGGAVSQQALLSYNLTPTQAIGLVSYETGTQSAQESTLDIETYESLVNEGVIDAPDLR
jgi:hypothetical protein